MKILYVNPSSQLGGAERSLLDVICAVCDRDPWIEIVVLITAGDGPLVTELTAIGVKVILLELPTKIAQLGDSDLKNQGKIASLFALVGKLSALTEFGRYWQNLRRTIAEIAPDIIHSNGLKTHLLVASLRTNTPIIWHLRDFIGSRSLIKQLLKLFVGRVTIAVAISQAIARDWQSVFPQLAIETIYNAIDLDKYRPQTTSSPSSSVKIGLIATYSLWKGHDIFIQAIGQIAKQTPELKSTVRFYIIGGAIYETDRSQHSRTSLQQLASDLNVEDWLEFIDFQRDIVSSYNMLDIVIHASTQPEPFGRTIVEAMACEKAVIVSKAGGAAELFTERLDAIGVPPGDYLALATAIQESISSPDLRIALGKAGRITVKNRFQRDRLGAEIITLYQKIDNLYCIK
ncbi:MAG: glycosyltransferase [Chamaesiphon sp. CSU_1_12]|nr:glycosyltransferase [Chamaesiphon sp. CSU_1_12]